MKITKNTIIDILLTSLFGVGVGMMVVGLINFDIKLFLIALPITIGLFILLGKFELKKMTDDPLSYLDLRIIAGIDALGFTLEEKGSERKILWNDISSIRLAPKKELSIKFHSGKKIFISDKYVNWFQLLKQIPKSKLYNNEILDYLAEVHARVKNCKICGRIAVENSTCLSCGSEVYNDSMKDEHGTLNDYIREEQLFLFSLTDEEEKVDFLMDDECDFELDPDWKPIVTEEEVMKYSRDDV